MPFDGKIKNAINDYVMRDMPNDEKIADHFNYIEDEKLRERLFLEFKSIRYMYKIFEGIEAIDETLLFQIRSQVIFYAGIYEAIIHYVLFEKQK